MFKRLNLGWTIGVGYAIALVFIVIGTTVVSVQLYQQAQVCAAEGAKESVVAAMDGMSLKTAIFGGISAIVTVLMGVLVIRNITSVMTGFVSDMETGASEVARASASLAESSHRIAQSSGG
jgi:predicted metalloprotease